jgi:hypothetical protein
MNKYRQNSQAWVDDTPLSIGGIDEVIEDEDELDDEVNKVTEIFWKTFSSFLIVSKI